MKAGAAIVAAIALTSCGSLEQRVENAQNTIAVTENENATVCWKVTAESPNPFVPVRIEAKGIEIPAGVDPNAISLETIQALEPIICP